MTQSADLLRLLEPAVRPVSPVKPMSGAAGVAEGELPFESQDFDSLLASARDGVQTQREELEASPHATAAKPPGPLDALADFGRIENSGLRELLAQQRTLSETYPAA